jgi:hypothetical protein
MSTMSQQDQDTPLEITPNEAYQIDSDEYHSGSDEDVGGQEYDALVEEGVYKYILASGLKERSGEWIYGSRDGRDGSAAQRERLDWFLAVVSASRFGRSCEITEEVAPEFGRHSGKS